MARSFSSEPPFITQWLPNVCRVDSYQVSCVILQASCAAGRTSYAVWIFTKVPWLPIDGKQSFFLGGVTLRHSWRTRASGGESGTMRLSLSLSAPRLTRRREGRDALR